MSADRTLDSPIDARRLQAIYDHTAPFYDGLVLEDQVHAKQLALRLLDRRPGERLLEAGVGTGWLLARLASRSGSEGLTGVDLAAGMLAVTRDRLAAESVSPLPAVALADLRALPFRDGAFDCAVCTHTLDVMTASDAASALRELLRVLRPGGRLVCVNLTPGEDEDAAFSKDWQRRFANDPEYFGGARPVLLTPALSAAGFVDVQRHYSGHGRGWPSEVLLAFKP